MLVDEEGRPLRSQMLRSRVTLATPLRARRAQSARAARDLGDGVPVGEERGVVVGLHANEAASLGGS
jgi:hypothetical protein